MIVWMDSFDHYGSVLSGDSVSSAPGVMDDGPYAGVEGIVISPGSDGSYTNPYGVPPRTGPFHCRLSGNNEGLRRSLGGNYQVVGFGGGYYFHAMPTGTSNNTLISFRDANNNSQISVGMDTTGALVVRRDGDGGTIIHTNSSPDLVTAGWQHIEARLDCDAVNGALEVRVNGVTKINLTGINTRPKTDATGGAGRVAQIRVGTNNSGIPGFQVDDIFAWVDTGDTDDANNDFIGDRRVVTLFPNGDTAEADFSVTGGSGPGYDAINDVHTDSDGNVDDDSSYIGSVTPGDVSEFALDNLPANAAVVTAIQTYVRMKKTEAGVCNVQVSMLDSGGSADDGDDRPITESYTYWMDVSELNPNSGAPWTPSEVNAAKLRIARTA